MTKNNFRNITKAYAYFQTMKKKHLQSFKKEPSTIVGVATIRYLLSVLFKLEKWPTIYTVWARKMTKLEKKTTEKVIKIKIISGTYQKHMHYLQTMTKTPAKFPIDPSTTVGGVAFTRDLLSEGGIIESQILCSLAFLRKGGGQKINQLVKVCPICAILTPFIWKIYHSKKLDLKRVLSFIIIIHGTPIGIKDVLRVYWD